MPTTFEINVENDMDKIYPGDTLRGNVWMTSTEDKIVHRLYIVINRKAKQVLSNEKESHTGLENIMNERRYLVGGPREAFLGKYYESIKYFRHLISN